MQRLKTSQITELWTPPPPVFAKSEKKSGGGGVIIVMLTLSQKPIENHVSPNQPASPQMRSDQTLARWGPLTTISGFIPSYTHLQLCLNRVCWGYNYLITRGGPFLCDIPWNPGWLIGILINWLMK